MARINIDSSASLVVLVCEGCGGAWRACAWSVEEAHERAVAHEKRTHPGEVHAYHARYEWQRRARRRARAALVTRR